MRAPILLLVGLLLVAPAFAAVNISSCGAGSVITSADVYYVNASLSGAPNSGSEAYACIVIDSSDVVLDCQGNLISHDDSANTTAIHVNGSASSLTNVTIRNCRIRDYAYGIVVDGPNSGYNSPTILNNTITSNVHGIYVPDIFGEPAMTDNLIANNTGSGYQIDDYFAFSIWLQRDRMLGNGKDINYTTGASGFQMNVWDVVFGDASGAYGANATIYQYSSSRSWGIVDWVPSPAAPSAGHSSFLNKSVNITPDYIDLNGEKLFNVTMKWTDAEAGSALQEAGIQMWLINDSGSHLLNSSPDVSNNRISASVFLNDSAASSVFALYRNNACPVLGSSGTYVLSQDYSGAPNPTSSGFDACIVIDSDDVVLDCNGHTISYNDTANTVGIIVDASTSARDNVTIRNCRVRDYESGILGDAPSSGRNLVTLQNNTAWSNSYGVRAYQSFIEFTMLDNTLSNNTAAGYRNDDYFDGAMRMARDRYFGNLRDTQFPSGGSAFNITLEDVLFGNAAGSQYANVSMDHYTSDRTLGIMDWVESPAPPSASHRGFLNKSLNFTLSYVASFDDEFDISMGWTSAEGTAQERSSLELWLFNDSGSFLLNDTPSGNRLSVFGYELDDASGSTVLGLYVNQGCPVVGMSGTYSQDRDFFGAPNLLGGVNNVCVLINSSDVDWDCNGHSITNDGTDTSFGVYVNGPLDNVTIRNCANVSGYVYGIYVYNTTNAVVRNNTAGGSFQSAFATPYSPALVQDNHGYGSGNGFYVSSGNTIINNTALGNARGFYLDGGVSTGNSFFNNTAGQSSQYGFQSTPGANGNLFRFNLAFDNTYDGFELNSNSNNLSNNTAHGQSGYAGFSISGTGNLLGNNTAYGNGDGIRLNGASNTVTSNNATNNTYFGIISTNSGNAISGNTVSLNEYGIDISATSGNAVTMNDVSLNQHGIGIYASSGTTLSGNEIHHNSPCGLEVINSDGTLASGEHLYANNRSIRMESTSAAFTANLTNLIIDRAAGDYQNYTNLSINDSVSGNSSYAINWSANTTSPGETYLSLLGKSVNISREYGSVSIDSIVWNYLDSDVGALDEGLFVILKYNGTWSDIGAVLDSGANTLGFSGLNPQSDYGIFEGPAGCPVILSSGPYAMTLDYAGAPNIVSGGRACVVINSNDVDFSCEGYNITNNGTAGNTYGILINGSLRNITIRDCPAISQYTYGINAYRANDSLISNVTVLDNYGGIYMESTQRTNVSQSTIANNSGVGIYLTDSADHSTVSGNLIYNNSFHGVYVVMDSANNVFRNNTAYLNTNHSFAVEGCANNSFLDNVAHSNARNGFYAFLSPNTTLRNNTAFSNPVYGIEATRSNSSTVENNTLTGNGNGVTLESSFYVGVLGNNISSNSGAGIYLTDSADNNTIAFNVVNNNSFNGIYLVLDSYFNNITGNLVFDNSPSGISLEESYYNSLAGNTVHGNAAGGTNLSDSGGITIRNDHYYANSPDFMVSAGGAPRSINLSNVAFDSYSGTFQNYTNLSLNDSVDASSSYSIDWTATPAMPEPFLAPFAGKFVNISALAGTTSIDRVAWSWLASEAVAPYDESRFELWKQNSSGWMLMNNTPNTVSHELSLSAMNPASIYGILNATDNCPIVTADYVQTGNFRGSPNVVSGGTACVVINADNIIYDCNGFNITGNGSGISTFGIIADHHRNVTIRNCPGISNYSWGVEFNDVNDSAIINSTSYNNTYYGFWVTWAMPYNGSNRNLIANNTAHSNGNSGFFIGGYSNNISGNVARDNSVNGIWLASLENNRILNNSASGNVNGAGILLGNASANVVEANAVASNRYGITLNPGSGRNLVNLNNVSSNSITGIALSQAPMNNLTGNRVNSTAGTGIDVSSSPLVLVSGNTAYLNIHGIALRNASSGCTVSLNNATQNSQNGIFLSQVSANNVTGNALSSNSNYGIYLSASPGNRVEGNNASSNMNGIRLDGVSNGNLVDSNTVRSNTAYGIVVSLATQNNITRNNATLNNDGIYLSAPGNRVLGNAFSDNANVGIYVTGGSSTNNLIADNLANGNTNYGIFVAASGNDYNNLTNNTANQNYHGIWVQDSEYCILRNNRADNNTDNGFYIGTAAHNTQLHNNTAGDNGGYGFYLISSDICTMADNTAFGNSDGIDAESATSLTFLGNTVHDNLGFGMRVWVVTDSMLYNTTAYNNPLSGIVVRESGGIDVTDSLAHDNGEVGIYLASSDTNSILRNNASSNGLAGIFLNMSDSNTIEDNLADSNVMVGIGMDNSTLNGIARCNASNSLYGFVFVNSPSNTLTDSIGHDFTDLGDGGGDPFLTTGGRALAIGYSSDNNLVENNMFYQATMILADVDSSDGNTLRNNSMQGSFLCAAVRSSDATALEENIMTGCLAGAVTNVSTGTAFTQNNMTGNIMGLALLMSNQTGLSMNAISNNLIGMMHTDSAGTLMQDDHFFNNSAGDLMVNMAIMTPGALLNLSRVVFDSPGGAFQNHTVVSLDDTLGVESYSLSWADDSTVLPLPPDTESFHNKYVNISDLGNGSVIDRVVWHWQDAEVPGFTESGLRIYENDGSWSNAGATLSAAANTLTIDALAGFSVFAVLYYDAPEADETRPEPEEGYAVSIRSACNGFIVSVKDGGTAVDDAFLKIMDDTNARELPSIYTNASGQAFVPYCDIDVSIKASKSGRSGTEDGFAGCGFCPECATDEDCASSEQCLLQECVPINCPRGRVVDHACELYECMVDADCPAGQVCIDHFCELAYECYLGDANTTADDNDDCDADEYCRVEEGDPGGTCEQVEGCGEIIDHALVPWECGDMEACPACPEGELCIGHACVAGDLSCPASGLVGERKTCSATENGEPCVNCDYEVATPDGKKLTGKTDAKGSLGLPLTNEGTYRITLLKDGQAIKVLAIRALPRSEPEDEGRAGATGAEAAMTMFLVILLLFVLGAILYWRRRGGKEAKPAPKKQ